jgi:ubiquinone/menaquinone biosynthesis C-methylase UbiE
MTAKAEHATEIQRQYYGETAAHYEQMHAHEGAGDDFSMRLLHAIVRMVDAQSVLDVGTATGLNLRALKNALPHLSVCGIEPVRELIEQAAQHGPAVPGSIFQARGEALPFRDASFDVVCEFAVLHHVSHPGAVISEMLRVARKAVFISDSNRFGQGSRTKRIIKLLLFKSRLWGVFNYLRTSGKGFTITEGDGLSYSYSVYDSFQQIAEWADRLILIPTGEEKVKSWIHPLLTSSGVIVCALRQGRKGG